MYGGSDQCRQGWKGLGQPPSFGLFEVSLGLSPFGLFEAGHGLADQGDDGDHLANGAVDE